MATSLQQYDDRDPPHLTRGVRVLLAIAVAMLFLQRTIVSDADTFAMLGFHGRTVWSAVTYMFVHFSVWHLALNMYVLLLFGPRLESTMGTRAFTLYFLWCGLGGAIFHLLFVRSGLLIGSSAAVFGVMFAYAQQWPRDEIALFGVIPMRTWALCLGLVGAILAAGILGPPDPTSGANGWIYLAHAGGLAFGWLYLRTPPAASLDRLRQRISPAPDYPDEAPPRAIPRTLPRARTHRDEVDEIVAKSKSVASQNRPVTRVFTTPSRSREDARVAELDRLLDKISFEGLASLSAEERALLDESAKRLRGES